MSNVPLKKCIINRVTSLHCTELGNHRFYSIAPKRSANIALAPKSKQIPKCNIGAS